MKPTSKSRIALLASLSVFAVLASDVAAAIAPPVAPPPTVVSRDLDSRVWQTVRSVQAGDQTVLKTNAYKELKTGMHYFRDGALLESQETIQIVNGYGVADQGQHQAIFSPSITDSPATDYSDPAGKRLQARILGIALYDSGSGATELIAETKPAIGTVDGNTVHYPDAFSEISADVRYTYKINSFEQEIVLLKQLPVAPEDFQMDPARTRIVCKGVGPRIVTFWS